MRLTLLRNSALCSLLGLTSAQSSSSTWAQTQPFNVDVSTDSLLGSSQQPLTNVVASSTPATTALAPVATVTDEFSTSIPTELSLASSGTVTSVVVVTSGGGAGQSASVSVSASASASSSRSESVASERSASASASARASSSSASRAVSSGTGAAVQSTGAAAAPVGVHGQQKMMGVAGALAGAAGVLFV